MLGVAPAQACGAIWLDGRTEKYQYATPAATRANRIRASIHSDIEGHCAPVAVRIDGHRDTIGGVVHVAEGDRCCSSACNLREGRAHHFEYLAQCISTFHRFVK